MARRSSLAERHGAAYSPHYLYLRKIRITDDVMRSTRSDRRPNGKPTEWSAKCGGVQGFGAFLLLVLPLKALTGDSPSCEEFIPKHDF